MPDWSRLFAAAELDQKRFHSATPGHIPPVPFDNRAAWEGTFAPGRTERVHVEAAAWAGKPVYFRVGGNWQEKEPADVAAYGNTYLRVLAVFLPVYFAAAAILTWQNLRKGRGDRRGARQLATAVFVAAMRAGPSPPRMWHRCGSSTCW